MTNNLTMTEIYDACDKIGCLTFSTLNNEEIASRIAHFIAYDDDGLYFTTMCSKPYYKQLTEGKKLTVSGMYPQSYVSHDENNLPYFKPGYTLRIAGETRELSLQEVCAKAEFDQNFNVAMYDIKKYPATKVFVMHKGKGEIYDYDFAKENRDHKLYRRRFAFGGATYEPAGLKISEKCISCGKCQSVCTFDAIEAGIPYKINGNRCDECGNCMLTCPVGAISTKGK